MKKDQPKINKELALSGKFFKLIMPKASKKIFRFCNAVLGVFVKGKLPTSRLCYERKIVEYGEGRRLPICVYSPKRKSTVGENSQEEKSKPPIVLWIHGGGYAIGTPNQDLFFVRQLISAIGCTVVAPDYTLSVDEPYPRALDDCYAALLWVADNAENLGCDSSKVFVGGDSAGGGLTAALCMYARDKNEVSVAFQMPLYPMLDDRPTRTNANNTAPCWNSQANDFSWRLYLKGVENVDCYAAPARATDYSNLPPALTYVGDIEPFYAETLDFVNNLKKYTEVRFKVFAGCFHAFDVVCPNTKISAEAREFFREGLIFAAKSYACPQPKKCS